MKIEKIVLIGPESTGKTTLAKELAGIYNEPYIAEYARKFINELDRPYEFKDLEYIAWRQLNNENYFVRNAHQFIFCDTNILTVKIWSEYKYGKVAEYITKHLEVFKYDLYLLCGIDVPWEADPQREHPNPEQRRELYDIYKKELEDIGANYIELSGSQEERLKAAQEAIEKLKK